MRTRCDYCNSPLDQVTEPRRLARGDEFVIVDQAWLACPKECKEYDGTPFTVSNSWEENERRAQAAWVEKYGHSLSYSKAANVVVSLRLTPELTARLDKARGLRSRSFFLRAWLSEHLSAG